MRKSLAGLLMVAVMGCSSNGEAPPLAAAAILQSYLDGQLDAFFAQVGRLQNSLGTILSPAAAAAAGVTFAMDPSPGAPPNSYVFEFPFDSDGDGTNDTTATGTAVLSGNPLLGMGNGFSAAITFDIAVNGVNGSIAGAIDITYTARGIELFGSGTFVDNAEGQQGTFDISPATPVLITTPATAGQGNLCGLDVQGPVNVTVGPTTPPIAQAISGLPPGHFAAVLEFFFGNRTIQAHDSMYNDAATQEAAQPVPDSSITLPACGGGPTIAMWTGPWTLNWNCVPTESGTATVTFVQTGPNTLTGTDEDPPGSGSTFSFTATADPGNPFVVRGFFIDTDDGGTCREDFIFTMAAGGNSWIQSNSYLYESGPLQGTGGVCFGTATPNR